jgi:hypothetical protein
MTMQVLAPQLGPALGPVPISKPASSGDVASSQAQAPGWPASSCEAQASPRLAGELLNAV